jgi:hypothetical protein
MGAYWIIWYRLSQQLIADFLVSIFKSLSEHYAYQFSEKDGLVVKSSA